MTKARCAGIDRIGFAGRHRGRTRALLMALPLLLLSLLFEHGITGAAEHRAGMANGAGRASDMTGAEGKAQIAGRSGLLSSDPQRTKPKLSGDGPDAHGLTPPATLALSAHAATATPGAAGQTPAASWPAAPHPRGPPEAA